MKRALVLALLVAACATPGPRNDPGVPPPTVAAADAAGNQLEALVPRNGRLCTAAGAWCVAPTGEFFNMSDGSSVAIEDHANDAETQAVWPWAIHRANGHVILGMTFQKSDMYSGGGATMGVLTLYDVAPGADAATPVATLPDMGTASIRACFDEQDRRARRDACADEYEMAGSINLDASYAGPWPRLVLTTEAWTFPGHVSRTEDSTKAPPLTSADLIWVRDETCSYRRVLTFGSEGYAPDTPLPECSDYATQ